jgi:hypothetical protein
VRVFRAILAILTLRRPATFVAVRSENRTRIISVDQWHRENKEAALIHHHIGLIGKSKQGICAPSIQVLKG